MRRAAWFSRRRANAFLAVLQGDQPDERPGFRALALATAVCLTVVAFGAALPAVGRAVAAARGTGAAAPIGSTTPVKSLVVGPGGPCCATHGDAQGWTFDSRSGAPDFHGEARWTTNVGAWYGWSPDRLGAGRDWDRVGVRVWIPDEYASARVRYTVTSAAAGTVRTRTFDVSQQARRGWYALPATFSIGTGNRRTGTIDVRMTYLGAYTGPDTATCTRGRCGAMAAAQVDFRWS